MAAKENETIEKRRMSLHPTSGQIQDQVNTSQLWIKAKDLGEIQMCKVVFDPFPIKLSS